VTSRAPTAALLLVLLVGCGAVEAPVEQTSDLFNLLPPEPELTGWSISEGPVRYTPETLYEYINGGADRYLTHGFQQLLHVRYQLGDDFLAGVTLDVYDMGAELGAFGIYSAARAPGVEVHPWGAEGYRSGPIAAAWKGAFYVHGEADDRRPELIEMLERLVAGVCERASGDPSMPAALDPLPVAGRVAQSERYVPADLLGHSFLPGGVLATYVLDGQRAELFLSDLGNETAAVEALAALRDHLASRGRFDGEVKTLGAGGFRYSDPTIGSGTVIRSGRFIAGIQGDAGSEEREAVLAELIRVLALE
jgi:hypothetical protein